MHAVFTSMSAGLLYPTAVSATPVVLLTFPTNTGSAAPANIAATVAMSATFDVTMFAMLMPTNTWIHAPLQWPVIGIQVAGPKWRGWQGTLPRTRQHRQAGHGGSRLQERVAGQILGTCTVDAQQCSCCARRMRQVFRQVHVLQAAQSRIRVSPWRVSPTTSTAARKCICKIGQATLSMTPGDT